MVGPTGQVTRPANQYSPRDRHEDEPDHCLQTRPPRCAWHTDRLRSGLSAPRPSWAVSVPGGPPEPPSASSPHCPGSGSSFARFSGPRPGRDRETLPGVGPVLAGRKRAAVRCCPAVSLPPGPGGLPAKSPAESPQSGFTSSSCPGAGPCSHPPRLWGGEKSESAAGGRD